MKNSNDFLQDETYNDKLLVKELSVFLKNHRDKKLPINKKFIMDCIKIIQSNDPDLSLDEINFIEDTDECTACFFDGRLYFNMRTITRFYDTKKRYELCKEIPDNRLYKYDFILTAIIHELTHCKQEYLAYNCNHSFYLSTFYISDDFVNVYNENHDLFPYERFANIRSDIITNEVLSYVYSEKELKILKKLLLLDMLMDYLYDKNMKLISPYDRYLSVIEGIKKDNDDKTLIKSEYQDLYSKLYLGIDVSEDDLDYINDIIDKIDNNEHVNIKEELSRKIR